MTKAPDLPNDTKVESSGLVIDPDTVVHNGLVYLRGQTGTPGVFKAYDLTRSDIRLRRDDRTYRALVMYVRLNNDLSFLASTVRYYVIAEQADSQGKYFAGVIHADGDYRLA
jgi:hypothetical protein